MGHRTTDRLTRADGLTVRGILGRPRVHVPAARILHAEASPHVSPQQYVEGHGWHTSMGATRGVVVREGGALVVDRQAEVPFVVTVDDAATAAALLNKMTDRVRSDAPG
jgi:hypothetical protein